jgi:hypothetical protein
LGDLVAKLLAKGLTIGDVSWVKDVGLNYWTQGRGKTRGGSIAERVLYEGKRQNAKDKPYLKGRDTTKYSLRFSNRWLRYNYQELLDPDADTFRFSPEFLTPEKIIYRQTADELIATIDTSGMLVDKTLHVIALNPEWVGKMDLRYLLGLLNSRLLTYIYRARAQEEGRTFAQVKIFRVRELPLPDADAQTQAEHGGLVALVDRILKAKREDGAADTAALEREIDERVYRLYGLTAEEIKIVEEASR